MTALASNEIICQKFAKKNLIKQIDKVVMKPVFGVCEQQSCRQAFASAEQRHCYSILKSILSKLATGETSIF